MRYTTTEAAPGSGIRRHYDYQLGRFLKGYFMMKKIVRSLEERGFRVGEFGHITPTEGWSYRTKEPFPGFLHGSFLEGYTLRVHLPATDNPDVRQHASQIKDICDRL